MSRAVATAASTAATAAMKPLFDYYVVLDFEATCAKDVRLRDQEIIEFPSVLIDAHTNTVVAEFQRYVKPIANPTLTAFCTELTGIQQKTVDAARPFDVVLGEYQQWLSAANIGPAYPQKSAAMVTCGDWDLKTMFPTQLRVAPHAAKKHFGAAGAPPALFTQWVNIKTAMQRHIHARCRSMPEMLEKVGLTLLGNHHSGIDDCRNIARVLRVLLAAGHRVDLTQGPHDTEYWLGATHPAPPTTLDDVAPAWVKKLHDENLANGSVPPPAPAAVPVACDTPVAAPAEAAAGRAKKPHAAPKSGATPGPYLEFSADRDAAADILATHPLRASLQPAELKSVSKKMSWLLRHGALDTGVAISSNGFIQLDVMLKGGKMRQVTPAMVATVVQDSDKQRYKCVYGKADGKVYIRANQGHSMAGIDVDLTQLTPETLSVPIAVHGTDIKSWNSIKNDGLNRMTRQHIHMAKGLPGDAQVISGMRQSCKIFIYVDLTALLRDGVAVYESDNGVILSAGIDGVIAPRYFHQVTTSDGVRLFPLPEAAQVECDTLCADDI